KKEVRNIVSQRTTDEEFHRKVVNTLGILSVIGFLCSNPSLRENVTHRACDRFKTLASADRGCSQDVVEYQMPFVQRILRPSELDRAAPVSFYKLVQFGWFYRRRFDYYADLFHDIILLCGRECVHVGSSQPRRCHLLLKWRLQPPWPVPISSL